MGSPMPSGSRRSCVSLSRARIPIAQNLAKLLPERFGSFSEVKAAPRERLVEFEPLRESTGVRALG